MTPTALGRGDTRPADEQHSGGQQPKVGGKLEFTLNKAATGLMPHIPPEYEPPYGTACPDVKRVKR